MAISDEITRLQQAKAALKTSIEGKGVTVSSSATLDDYADLVDSIEAGGGNGDGKYLYVNLDNAGTTQSNPYVIQLEQEPIFIDVREKQEHSEYFCFERKTDGKRTQVITISDQYMKFYLSAADMISFSASQMHKVKSSNNYPFQ